MTCSSEAKASRNSKRHDFTACKSAFCILQRFCSKYSATERCDTFHVPEAESMTRRLLQMDRRESSVIELASSSFSLVESMRIASKIVALSKGSLAHMTHIKARSAMALSSLSIFL